MLTIPGTWVGFDLDGVLAVYNGADNNFKIGEPIAQNVERCKRVMKRFKVKIFTARVDGGLIYPTINRGIDNPTVELYRQVKFIVEMIQDWTEKHLGARLEVTCQKDAGMLALYDDRAIQMDNNGDLIGFDFILKENSSRTNKVKTLDPYPIQDGPSVPWEAMRPHAAQAIKNHSQTLEHLAERGGLGCSEAYCVVNAICWYDMEFAIGHDDAKKRWIEFAERINLHFDELERLRGFACGGMRC